MKRLLLVLLLGLVTAGCHQAREEPQAGPAFLATAKVVLKDFSLSIPFTGRVEAETRVELRALTEGRVVSIAAKDEEKVDKGATILTLGGPRFDAAAATLASKAAALEKRLALANERIERVSKNLARRLATEDDLAAARETALSLDARLTAARASRHRLAELAALKAPVAGIFTGRRVSLGQELDPGDRVGWLLVPDKLRIRASLFPPEGSALEGKEAVIRDGSETIRAVVSRLLPERDETGATRIFIEGEAERFHPGQPVAGVVELGHRRSPAVPDEAIVYDDKEQAFLFVKEGKGYERRPVTTGLRADGFTEIRHGIAAGRTIVTKGAYELDQQRFSDIYQVED